MKTFQMTSLILSVLVAGQAWSSPAQVRRGLTISNATIPSGFDNSQPSAVISGLFPNSCYSWDKAEVTNLDSTTHEVRAFAQVKPGMCLMVIIPYSEELALGKFVTGHHTIRFINGDDTYLEKTLDVN